MKPKMNRVILLVEDEHLIAHDEAGALRRLGYEVIIEGNGESAVSAVRQTKTIDLVLMDIDLGKGMDGTEAARKILEVREVPIVFLTSHAEREMVEKVRGITRYGFVIKDSGDSVLQSSIEMAYELFEAHRSLSKELTDRQRLYTDGLKNEEEFSKAFSASPGVFTMAKANDGTLVEVNELFLRTTIDSLIEEVVVLSDTGRILLTNRAWREFENESVMKPDGLNEGTNYLSVCDTAIGPDAAYAREVATGIRAVISGAQDSFMLDYPCDTPQEHRWFRARVSRFYGDGPARIVIVHENITERRVMEEDLRTSKERFQQLAEVFPETIFEADLFGKVTFANPHGLSQFCVSPADIASGVNLMSLVSTDDRSRIRKRIAERLAGLTGGFLEYTAVRKDGRTFSALAYSAPIWSNEKIVGIRGFILDVTEKKQSEDVLRWNQTLLQLMASSSPFGFLVVDNRTDAILYFNHRFCTLWGIEHLEERMRRGELRNNDIIAQCMAVVRDVDAFAASCKPLQDEANRAVVEDEIGFNEGRTIRRFSTQIRSDRDEYFGRFTIFEDITNAKKIDQEVRSLLREKEMLLKEVHHRIKNNMNTIRSILALQAASIPNESARGALLESQNRIQSMMLLYDKLYRSTNVTELFVDEYLGMLVDDILANFPNRDVVTVSKTLEHFAMDPKRLLSVGMILNELLTNTMKYAFVGRPKGALDVTMARNGRRATLVVQDDGVGFPISFDMQNSTGFGLQMVSMLAQQVDGMVVPGTGEGARWTLEFDIEAH